MSGSAQVCKLILGYFKVQSDVTSPILSPLDVIQKIVKKIELVSKRLDNTVPSVLDMCQ